LLYCVDFVGRIYLIFFLFFLFSSFFLSLSLYFFLSHSLAVRDERRRELEDVNRKNERLKAAVAHKQKELEPKTKELTGMLARERERERERERVAVGVCAFRDYFTLLFYFELLFLVFLYKKSVIFCLLLCHVSLDDAVAIFAAFPDTMEEIELLLANCLQRINQFFVQNEDVLTEYEQVRFCFL
jgi:hypothetical protein